MATRNPAAQQPAAAPAVDANGKVQVTIARGTFTDRDGDDLVNHGPGSTVFVTVEDRAMLIERGLVRGDDYVPPDEVQDGRLKITAGEGPTVTAITPA